MFMFPTMVDSVRHIPCTVSDHHYEEVYFKDHDMQILDMVQVIGNVILLSWIRSFSLRNVTLYGLLISHRLKFMILHGGNFVKKNDICHSRNISFKLNKQINELESALCEFTVLWRGSTHQISLHIMSIRLNTD